MILSTISYLIAAGKDSGGGGDGLTGQPIGTIDGIGNFVPVDNDIEGTVASTQLDSIFSTLLAFLTITAGLAFLIYFIIGALNWVTAGGDTKKVDTAKNYLVNGAIGMIIIVAAYSIIWIIGKVLGLDILNPGNSIQAIFK